MKKFLFYIIFLFLFVITAPRVFAQEKDPASFSLQDDDKKSDDGVIVAYPNPARDVIYLKIKNPALKIKTVTFYSVIGMQVAQYSINMNTAEIRLDKLKSGKYLIRYTLSDNSQRVTQIVKQ